MDAPTRNHLGHAFEHGFRLDGLRIEPVTGEVIGPGSREKLDPKVMGVLLLLAQNAGQVVSRDDLHAQLWPNAVVTDDALTRCIHELRRQLSSAGGDERYRTLIETLPKRGYRLNGVIAPFHEPAAAPGGSRSRNLWLAAAAAAVMAIGAYAILGRDADPGAPAPATRASIAVLPFVDMSEAQDQGYLADGVAEEILNSLAKAGNLRVVARTSSFSFRDSADDIAEIAGRLAVSHVLEGSVRRSGDRVRITAQLIAAHDSSHVWSETYDRAFGELFEIQDEIASAIAAALEVTLAGGAAREQLSANSDAYDRYLRGRFFYDRRAPGDVARAADYFEQATAADPGFARAWATLSGAYSLLTETGEIPAETGRNRQREAALRAVALAPELAEAQSRLSRYYYDVGNLELARQHRLRAEALDPDDALVLGASAGRATWRRDFPEAIAIERRIVARDPLSTIYRSNLASNLAAAGRHDEAIRELEALRELNPDPARDFERFLAQLYLLQGRDDEALAVVRSIADAAVRDRVLALFHRVPGLEAEAQAALERLTANPARDLGVALAEAQAFRGDREAALASLARAWDTIEADRSLPVEHGRQFQINLRISPILRPLHGDPRFEALVAERYPPRFADSAD